MNRNELKSKRELQHKIDVYEFIFAFVLCFIFWAVLLFAIPVRAADLELSAGRTVYNPSDHGIWWQRGSAHHLKTEANSVAIGLTDYATDSMRWHVGYQHLGDISTWAIATTDADYNGSGCISSPCASTAVFIGRGYVHGIYASLAPEWQVGPVKLFLQGGLWVYQASFRMVVIAPGANGNVVIWDKEKNDSLEMRPHIGLGIEYRKTQLILSAWGIDSSGEHVDTIPNYKDYAVNFSIKHLF